MKASQVAAVLFFVEGTCMLGLWCEVLKAWVRDPGGAFVQRTVMSHGLGKGPVHRAIIAGFAAIRWPGGHVVCLKRCKYSGVFLPHHPKE